MADREQFLTLFLQSESDLRAFIGSLVLDRHARDDVFQDCALTLWRDFDRYDPQRSFGAWARGVAVHKILQRRRADERFPVPFSPETIQAVRDAYDRTEAAAAPRAEALGQCLEQLPDHARELLRLRYERNLSAGDMAQQTGRTVAAMYQALSRIRAILEDCIRQRMTVLTS